MSNVIQLKELEDARCESILVRERWFMSNCVGEAAALYVRIEPHGWVEISPNASEACWQARRCDEPSRRDAYTEDGSHFRNRDAGQDYGLNGIRLARITQKQLGSRLEICLEFANATDLTLHYMTSTGESSLYFIKESRHRR